MHPGKLKTSTYRATTNLPQASAENMPVHLHAASRTPMVIRVLICAFSVLLTIPSSAQDWIRTGTGLGVEKVRLAASDFKPSTQDPKNAELLKTFNDTLFNDLDNAGIFDLVSKSFYPLQVPGQPA